MPKTRRGIPPIEVTAGPGHHLGMPPARFLREYWQKRPLLIRGAFPDFTPPLSPDDLAGLACMDGALARIVLHTRTSSASSRIPRSGDPTSSGFGKAKALDYISLAEIKAARKLGAKKKHEVDLPVGESNTKLKLVLDEEKQDSIKWLEWLSLFADLLDLYCNHGGHPEKLAEMLTHYRLMQRFGSDQTFTYESLISTSSYLLPFTTFYYRS